MRLPTPIVLVALCQACASDPGNAPLADDSGSDAGGSSGVTVGDAGAVGSRGSGDARAQTDGAAGGDASRSAPGSSCPVINGADQRLLDAQGNTWSLSGGVVLENGTDAGYTASVVELAFVGGTVYQENGASAWWAWESGTWVSAANPLGGCSPASSADSGTLEGGAAAAPTVLAGYANAVTDANGHAWTIDGAGQVQVDGTPQTATSAVTELALVGGTMWQMVSDGDWSSMVFTGGASSSTGGGTTSSPLVGVHPGTSTPSPLVVMPLGDSVTAGGGTADNGGPPPGSYRAPLYWLLESAGYNVSYVGDQTFNGGGGLPANEESHEGIGGITIEALQSRLQTMSLLQTYRPALIPLIIGNNDLFEANGLGPQTTYNLLVAFCQYIVQTLPDAKIIVSTVQPSIGTNEEEIEQYNALILGGITSVSPNISTVDIHAHMTFDDDIGPDQVHPNQPGDDAMATVFFEGVRALYP